MKIKYLILALAIWSCFSCNAMKERELSKNEIALRYGFFPYSDVLESDKSAKVYFLGCNETNRSKTGAINLTYNHRFNPTMGFGFAANYSGRKSQWASRGMTVGDQSVFYISFMPRLKAEWVHNKYFVLYSSIAAGAMWKRTTSKPLFNKVDDAGEFFDELGDQIKNEVKFAFQVSPIGLEVGNHVGIFVEAGFGQMGIAQGGLRFRW